MAKLETLVWHGGPHTVVELDQEIDNGDEIKVDPELAGRLLAAHGFTLKDGSNPLIKDAAELAGRKQLEKQADEMGLAIYPTEDDAALADRIRSAGGDPTKGTPKGRGAQDSSGSGEGGDE